MGFDHVKLEKGMYRESGKTFTQVLESLDPSENYRGTALEGTDAFQRQLKRFDIHAKGAYSDPVEKFFRTMDSSVLFPEYIARAVKQGMEENNVLPKITASTTSIDAMDYRSVYSVPSEQDKVKIIAIPTTSGTGSENTPCAVICDAVTGRKEIPIFRADLALADPVLTYTVPAKVTAATGLDVLAHCAEAITNRNYNAYANIVAKEGIRLTMKYLKTACEKPKNVEAREKMALAANLGGQAIAETGCSIGHSFSQTFGAMNHIPHGLGCAWALPSCMTYTAKYGRREDLAETADAMGVAYKDSDDAMVIAKAISDVLVAFMKELGVVSIKDMGYTLEDCLKSADLFQYDAAFANAPGKPSVEEAREYIKDTYFIYQ